MVLLFLVLIICGIMAWIAMSVLFVMIADYCSVWFEWWQWVVILVACFFAGIAITSVINGEAL